MTMPDSSISEATNGSTDPRVTRDYVATLRSAIDIAAQRHLALVATLGAVGIFGYAVWDPVPWRSWTAFGYAVLVLGPHVWAMSRKG